MIFLYQFGSLSSERMMSKDSKNGFESSVAAIQTHSKPIKVAASTVFYSIEVKHFLASKMVEMNFLLYKMMFLNHILKKLLFYLQKQTIFYSNQNHDFGKHVNFQDLYLGYYKIFFAIKDRMIISSDLESATSFYITKNSFQPFLRQKYFQLLYCDTPWKPNL